MSNPDCLPYYTQGKVVTGFGRGSKDLGTPTANFPSDVVSQLPDTLKCGVYYGWASVQGICRVHKMVVSVGWNVFYGNEIKTMETHIIKQFDEDFYGENLKIIILGFIRPMCNFDSLDALITAIHNDIQVAEGELRKEENLAYKSDPFFASSPVARKSAEESPSLVNGSQLHNGHSEENSTPQCEGSLSAVNSPVNGCSNPETSKTESFKKTGNDHSVNGFNHEPDMPPETKTVTDNKLKCQFSESIQQSQHIESIESNGHIRSSSKVTNILNLL